MVRQGPVAGVRPLIVVAGPTASGKSELAFRLALELQGEIISCDSVQVYRGFDIGSAKATRAERARVRHHLIDCCDADEQYNAARFRTDALGILEQLQARDVQPIIAGGTTLYLSALLSGLSEFPESDPVLREKIQGMEKEQRFELLRSHDPARAAQLHPNDTLRIVRALEIVMQTGKPVKSKLDLMCAAIFPWPVLIINLCVSNQLLTERISSRTLNMLAQGLVAEAKALLENVSKVAAPFSTVGYREALQFLSGELLEEELADKISAATRRLAKRQRTFWRNEPVKRGWIVQPIQHDAEDCLIIEEQNRASGRRNHSIQKGFLARRASLEQLQEQIKQRLSQPFSEVAVWNINLV